MHYTTTKLDIRRGNSKKPKEPPQVNIYNLIIPLKYLDLTELKVIIKWVYLFNFNYRIILMQKGTLVCYFVKIN